MYMGYLPCLPGLPSLPGRPSLPSGPTGPGTPGRPGRPFSPGNPFSPLALENPGLPGRPGAPSSPVKTRFPNHRMKTASNISLIPLKAASSTFPLQSLKLSIYNLICYCSGKFMDNQLHDTSLLICCFCLFHSEAHAYPQFSLNDDSIPFFGLNLPYRV